MISVVIDAGEGAEALASLLAALVPGAAEGIIREVLVFGASGPSAEVADDCGAKVCDDFAAALAAAKGPWLAQLPLGVVIARDFFVDVGRHVRAMEGTAARLVAPRRLLSGRALEGWLAPLDPRPSATPVQKDFERLARRSGRRLRVLQRS